MITASRLLTGMRDIQVFYNQEDLWEPPDEIFGNDRQRIHPLHKMGRRIGEIKATL